MGSANILLNNPAFKANLENDRITIVDGGARGKIFSPFNLVDQSLLFTIKFEPDPDANIQQPQNGLIVPKALWKQADKIKVNIAVQATASSVYPFNIELQRQIDPYIHLRTVKEVVEVDAISLDLFLEQQNEIKQIDFIKLDIHGCEYEVLEGASKVLEHTLGLLVENWIIPIHLGQKTRAAVELLLNDRNFYLFEQYTAGKWARQPEKFVKKQPITVDSLYFQNLSEMFKHRTKIQAVKHIGIAELFQHYGYAWQLNEFYRECELLDEPMYKTIKAHLNKKARSNRVFKMLQNLAAKIDQRLCTFST